MNIVLIGCHGAGKTTIGRALAAELKVVFHAEIGERLALDRNMRPSGTDATKSQPEFDRQVFQAELERDRNNNGEPRVVETWHPGNLAYADIRSPGVAKNHIEEIFDSVKAFNTLVIPVVASPATLKARKHEPGDLGFFMTVGRLAWIWAMLLGLQILEPVYTDGSNPVELARRLAIYVSKIRVMEVAS